MTKDEYREAIARLGLSQVKAGKLLTGNPRTSRRWALGESPVPKAVALLLRLMIQHKISPDELRDAETPQASNQSLTRALSNAVP